ncbi:MogA/MoaB family molybdenum cofactor biosynthesis protein [Limosilactobacillus sp. STM2_1]|uniref:Molybdenum cofactor biosynthesis protein B n=1 Tax=Limosilactobacillus rudii TaxID=2759755 RepID=A0A7W3YPC4_9LACO|nr:MogA/MoaB family molybdenum cofactor biosynthesis protein [Limosilactobacillus rudii]MBB1078887.1 MogA/MoaB family molybdenum cofactor biosynthesis protein [Limosilactobacillus rudii]MBB1098237.1 MogA/MoaB family molybdenum cofactor biosynthesis protein [Limosilactobacillus rudii]MCD7135648.1 MogA/MoaB family molybdenum cofactor biosynthesis protein [Limosilactobacillus rudii]
MKKLAILTISDSRSLETDESGKLITALAKQNDLMVIKRVIVPDDIVDIQTAYLQLEQQGPDIIITNGGTGIARRDVTIQAIRPLLLKTISGFGEAFRQISFEEIGTRALASQALAGFNYRYQLTYCLPGSKNACQTALTKLIIPEYGHLLFESSTKRKEVHHHAH